MTEQALEEVVLESSADAETQERAEKMGWIPPKRFKGDPERFVDAEKFLERGETVLPIVKEQNRRLQEELAALRGEGTKTAAELRQLKEAMEEVEVRHSAELARALAEQRRTLKANLAAASEAGDHEAVAELTEQMTELSAAEREAKAEKKVEKKTETPPATVEIPAEVKEWNADNPWFGVDEEKTSLALGHAQKLRKAGNTLQGRAFFDLLGARVEEVFGSKPRGDKVEGASHGAEGEQRRGKKNSYDSLPSEAKAQCAADAKRFVGEGRGKFKTVAEWNSRFAELYYQE